MSLESMEPFENSANFNEDVGLFEAATHSAIIEIPEISMKVIALVLDGSPRDATVKGFAEILSARTGARTEIVSETAHASDILAAVESLHADLLILPVPFGQDYRELGHESLGSIADQLLLKCPCALLCVREVQSQDHIKETLKNILIPIAVADELVPRALGWGIAVTPAGGRLDLIAVADRDVLAEASHLMTEQANPRALKPELLERALLRDIGAIVSAANKRGATADRAVHVETQVGKFIPLVLEGMHGHPHMIIWGITRDHSSPAFHRAVDLLLASTGPVLMV